MVYTSMSDLLIVLIPIVHTWHLAYVPSLYSKAKGDFDLPAEGCFFVLFFQVKEHVLAMRDRGLSGTLSERKHNLSLIHI